MEEYVDVFGSVEIEEEHGLSFIWGSHDVEKSHEDKKSVPGAPTAPKRIASNFLIWSNASSGKYLPCFL